MKPKFKAIQHFAINVCWEIKGKLIFAYKFGTQLKFSRFTDGACQQLCKFYSKVYIGYANSRQ